MLGVTIQSKTNSPRNVQIVDYLIQDIVGTNQSLNVLEYLGPAGLHQVVDTIEGQTVSL